jgi:hypothetical protein
VLKLLGALRVRRTVRSGRAGLIASLPGGGAQCLNGGGSPLTPVPCVNAAWQSGNANSNRAHCAEATSSPTAPPCRGSPAFDYLGSFDATETTSPTPPRCMPTNNNPCFDHLGSGAGSGCTAPGTPPVPASTFPVPPANLAAQRTCGGSSGLPTVPDGELPGRAHIHHHHRQPRNGQRHRHHRDRLPTRRGGSGVGRHTASARSMPAPVAGPSRCCQPGPPARSPWSCGCCQPRPDRRSPTSWR